MFRKYRWEEGFQGFDIDNTKKSTYISDKEKILFLIIFMCCSVKYKLSEGYR